MTPKDMESVLETYSGYRGAALADAERREFLYRFKAASRAEIERAVRDCADETGFVTLAGVAHRVTQVSGAPPNGPSPKTAAQEEAESVADERRAKDTAEFLAMSLEDRRRAMYPGWDEIRAGKAKP